MLWRVTVRTGQLGSARMDKKHGGGWWLGETGGRGGGITDRGGLPRNAAKDRGCERAARGNAGVQETPRGFEVKRYRWARWAWGRRVTKPISLKGQNHGQEEQRLKPFADDSVILKNSCSLRLKSRGGGGAGTQFVHGRSRMIVDLRPYYAGTEHIGFSPTMQALLAPSAKRREVFGESHEGQTASFHEPLGKRTSGPCAYFLVCGRQRQ